MDTLNNIRPGDRINISFSDSKVNKNNYKSSISDLISDDTWEITMPMESGKMVLFPLGISCDLVIFSQGNIMNKCTAVIKDRYKKDGLFFLIVKISSKLTKIQRREFFRVVCCIDMQYYTLETNEEEINILKSNNKVFGCDICQDVCPHNKNIDKTNIEEFYKDLMFNIDEDEILNIIKGANHA